MKASDFSIEPASAKHLYSITVMTKQYFPYAGLSMEKIGGRLRSKSFRYFVALYRGHSIGYVDLQLKGKTCKLLGLAVLPEFRGNGVGTKLLRR
ncbi:MAG: GNAT family N-acetyltransferase, partial [Candidatus Micrarchaeota archaeon]